MILNLDEKNVSLSIFKILGSGIVEGILYKSMLPQAFVFFTIL